MSLKNQPEIGDSVIWYEGGNREYGSRFTAVVTAPGFGTAVELSTIEPNMDYLRPRPGVKHIDDPSLRSDEATELGAWDWSPRMKAMLSILDQLGEAATATEPKQKKLEPATAGK